jgi:hypothetical protein
MLVFILPGYARNGNIGFNNSHCRFSKYPLMACLDAAYPERKENVSSCDTANHSDTTTIILLK